MQFKTRADTLTRAVPLLVLSGTRGVRACMGLLAPAVQSGVKVKVAPTWVRNGCGEPGISLTKPLTN